MKLFVFIPIIALISACATGDKNFLVKPHSDTINSRYVRLAPDTNSMMLIERVQVSFGALKIEADSAFYQKILGSITCYSIHRATFNGSEINDITPTTVLKYVKGEPRYYLK